MSPKGSKRGSSRRGHTKTLAAAKASSSAQSRNDEQNNKPKDGKADTPITEGALVQHDQEQARLAADPEQLGRLRQERSNTLKAAAESLGLEASKTLLGKMTQTYEEYGWTAHTK